MRFISNNKKRIMGAALMVLFGINAYADTANTTLIIGNNKKSSAGLESVKGATDVGSAIFFDANYMSAYKGCKLIDIQIAFPDTTANGAITIFLSHDLNGEPFYKETVDAKKAKWNTFELAKPYTIDGSALYVGYTIKESQYICYGTQLVKNPEYIKGKNGKWTLYEDNYSASLLATITGDNMPQHNVRLGVTNLPAYVKPGQVINYFGTYQNLGVAPVNSLTFALYDGDKELCSEHVEGLQTSSRREGSFELSQMKVPENGDYNLRLCIKSVNDEADAVTADNWSESVQTKCRDSYQDRKVLLETFSTEKCSGCPAAHLAINNAIKDMTDIIEIGHHAGFMADKYTIPTSSEYEWFYPSYRTFAPAMLVDRSDFRKTLPEIFKYETPILEASAENVLEAYKMAKQTPALATVNITKELNTSTRNVSIQVEGKQLLPLATPDSVRLYVFLTEDSIYTKRQAGAKGGFYHRHSPRVSLTPTWGDKIDIGNGYKCNYTTTLDKAWDMTKMNVVAFVANYNPTNQSDCYVLNTEKLDLWDAATGIDGPKAEATAFTSWIITDMYGRTINSGSEASSLSAAYSSLGHGIYVVSLSGNKGNKKSYKISK